MAFTKIQKISASLFVFLCIALIILNIFFGSQQIERAHLNNFFGGICGQDSSLGGDICNQTYGFDFSFLILSVCGVALILGLVGKGLTNNLFKRMQYTVVGVFVFILFVEGIIHIFSLPVLYTNLWEQRQSIEYRFISMVFIFTSLYLSLLCGLAGSLVGNIIFGVKTQKNVGKNIVLEFGLILVMIVILIGAIMTLSYAESVNRPAVITLPVDSTPPNGVIPLH